MVQIYLGTYMIRPSTAEMKFETLITEINGSDIALQGCSAAPHYKIPGSSKKYPIQMQPKLKAYIFPK